MEISIMEPEEVLHWLDRFGIRYRLHKGAFVTDGSLLLLSDQAKHNLPVLKASIAEHAEVLADLVKIRTPTVCTWCHLAIAGGARFVRVYAQEEGRRFSFHPQCHADRSEKLPDLPLPEILIDEPGYTAVIEDSGLCCYCQMQEAIYPEEAPNVCGRCWKIRESQKVHSGTGSASA